MANMAGKYSQEWKTRREVPNPQIKDAADQYEQARQILGKQPPGAGVLLPLISTATMAVELYLKCLAGEVIHVPESDDLQSCAVYAQANVGGHKFTTILGEIDEDVQRQMESIYVNATDRELKHDLSTIEGVLVVSRYPYEPDMDLSHVNLQTLMSLSEFLQQFVASLEPTDTIQWNDGSISTVEYL